MRNSAPFHNVYKSSLALLTDFYQITMAYGFWKNGQDRKEAVYHSFFRRAPFHGGFTVAAGLEYLSDYVENFRFDESDLAYLETLKDEKGENHFPKQFLDYL